MKYKNFFFLPIGLGALGFFTFTSFSLIAFLFLLFFLFLLTYRQQWGLIFWSILFCSVLIIRDHQLTVAIQPEQPTSGVVTVYADTIVVTGDQVRFDGDFLHHKTKFTYRVSTKQEQQAWQQRQAKHVKLQITGVFTTVLPATNQYGFDYRAYLKSEHYQGTVQIKTIHRQQTLANTTRWSHRLRSLAIARVESYIPKETALWINGLLFNYRQTDYYEFLTNFTNNGLLHLFSISGMHVYFFLGWLDFFFRRLHFTATQQLPFFLVLSLLLMSLFGGSIAIIRAILAYLAYWITKEFPIAFSGTDRYAAVLFVCLLLDPQALYQLSAQLSFLFSFFLVFITMRTDTILRKLLFAQLFPILSIPMLLYQFYEWPLASGFWTFVLVPYFELLLLPGAVVLFCCCSITWISQALAAVLTGSMVAISRLIEWVPLMRWHAGAIPFSLTVICTLGALWAFSAKRYKMTLVVAFVIPFCYTQVHPFAKITFIDVGQGDAIVIQSKWNREVYVIDTGGRVTFKTKKWKQQTKKANAWYSLIPYLKGEGINQINGLILTHGDTDHMGDARVILETFKVKQVYLGQGSQTHPNVKRLLKNFPTQAVQLVQAGQTIGKHQILKILAPKRIGRGENNDSVVIYTHLANRSFLFTGDLEQTGEQQLLKDDPHLTVDVLKVGHHGSKTSSDPDFLQKIGVREAVISVGRHNRYHHPHQETLATLRQQQIQILRTDTMGMIQYRSLGKKITRTQWLDD